MFFDISAKLVTVVVFDCCKRQYHLSEFLIMSRNFVMSIQVVRWIIRWTCQPRCSLETHKLMPTVRLYVRSRRVCQSESWTSSSPDVSVYFWKVSILSRSRENSGGSRSQTATYRLHLLRMSDCHLSATELSRLLHLVCATICLAKLHLLSHCIHSGDIWKHSCFSDLYRTS